MPLSSPVTPPREREATLYKPLAGAGWRAGANPTEIKDHNQARALAERMRKEALAAYERLELPVWRRSNFWTTSFERLAIEELAPRHHDPNQLETRELVEKGLAQLPDRERSGRIVQLDGSIVAVELSAEARQAGVTLCSLTEAIDSHPQIVGAHLARRLLIDRHKLEAANAAFWTGGIFLHLPAGAELEAPFELVQLLSGEGVAQHSRVLVVADRASDFRLHEYGLALSAGGGQALHTEAFELYLHDGARCRLAHLEDWGGPEVFNSTVRFVGVGRDAFCHWLPSQLGGKLMHEHLELSVCEPGGGMEFRGLFFTEQDELLDTFAVDLHQVGPSTGDCHFRGAATGRSRASMEGLIKINPGAQKSHTYLQIHTMMLSREAQIDAIPSVLVSADDVSASHGGTVGELDEAAIFYMQSRGLDRAAAVRVIVEGFFEPVITELKDKPLEELIRSKIAAKLARAKEEIEAYAQSR